MLHRGIYNTGANTFLVFRFLAPLTFTSISVTDRVTSGVPQGTCCGGNGDAVTAFDLVFSNDPTFATTVGTVIATRTPPSSPTSAANFEMVVAVPNLTARYVRYDVTGTAGNNPGASHFQFDVASIPANLPFTTKLADPALFNAATAFSPDWERATFVGERFP